jgi:iron complex outermembrane receptor protein
VIPSTPENLVFAEFSYRAPRGWFIAADALYVDDQFGDSGNTVDNPATTAVREGSQVPAYTVANMRMGWNIELDNLVLSPFLGVTNLGDDSYTANVRVNATANRYFEPGPTRTGYGGITVGWKFR